MILFKYFIYKETSLHFIICLHQLFFGLGCQFVHPHYVSPFGKLFKFGSNVYNIRSKQCTPRKICSHWGRIHCHIQVVELHLKKESELPLLDGED